MASESRRLEETKEQGVAARMASPSVHSWPETKAVRTLNKYTTGQVGRKRKERNKSHSSESWEEIRSSLSSRCKFGRKRETPIPNRKMKFDMATPGGGEARLWGSWFYLFFSRNELDTKGLMRRRCYHQRERLPKTWDTDQTRDSKCKDKVGSWTTMVRKYG